MQINVCKTVIIKGEEIKFSFVLFEVDAQHLLLGPDFYRDFGYIPKGMHHEIEILTPVWLDENRDRIHFFTSTRNGRRFICYPRPIETLDKAMEILSVWCVGTAFTLKTGIDFQNIESLKVGRIEFFQEMDEKHQVRLVA